VETLTVSDVRIAATILRNGGVVAFPTETVFGLGADATNPLAITKLFEAKGRPSDNPLIVHLAKFSDWTWAARELPDVAHRLLTKFSPGPLTVVVPKLPAIASAVTGGLDTVGIRIPAHPVARELIAAAGVPIAAPSANLSGRPSGTTWQTVLEDLDGRIDAVLMGKASDIGLESTVVDCVSQPPALLRPGAISLSQLQSVIPELVAASMTSIQQLSRSPGLRHAHYQPNAQITLVASAKELDQQLESQAVLGSSGLNRFLALLAYCGLDSSIHQQDLGSSRRFESAEQYAHEFFEFLRDADRLGIQRIYCQTVTNTGIGIALNDRLQRAAGKQ
jgi:L-threonylcarbamoyladenylate synthase